MAWPNFSELTFAFAYLRELEALKGTYDDLPDFISQAVEAEKGYDAAISQGGIVTFMQFKRSEVMTRSSAKELSSGAFLSKPVFRMHLHRHSKFAQHTALRKLEDEGRPVLYVTSAAQNRAELVRQAQNKTVLASSATFLPSEITLPNLTENHHVAFKPGVATKIVYSERGESSQRKLNGPDDLSAWLEHFRRSGEENRQVLMDFLKKHSPRRVRRPQADAPEREESLVARVRAVARMQYDLELVLLK